MRSFLPMRLPPLLAALACTAAQAETAPATAASPQRVARRRDFRRHPERGEQETRTAQAIAGQLRAFGLQPRPGIAGTGA